MINKIKVGDILRIENAHYDFKKVTRLNANEVWGYNYYNFEEAKQDINRVDPTETHFTFPLGNVIICEIMDYKITKWKKEFQK